MRPYFTQDEAAEYLRISLSAFKKHVRPAVPATRIGTKPVFDRAVLDTYMTDHRAFTAPTARRGAGSARSAAAMNKRAASIAAELEANGT